MNGKFLSGHGITRRELARAGLGGAAALCALAASPRAPVRPDRPRHGAAARSTENRILVVFELSGGNDGLNTLVPYADDAYYRQRPKIGIKPEQAAQARRPFRLQPGHGRLRAAVQGRQARDRAWLRLRQPVVLALHLDGLLADRGAEQRRRVRLGRPARRWHGPGRHAQLPGQHRRQRSRSRCAAAMHMPVVFDDPGELHARGLFRGAGDVPHVAEPGSPATIQRSVICSRSRGARTKRPPLVREAWAEYQTPIDYGIVSLGSRQGRGADRGRHAHAALLRGLSATTRSIRTCISPICTSAC